MNEEQSRSTEPTYPDLYDYPLEYIMGKFDPSEHEDFVIVENTYTRREGMYLHKDTYEAFKKMYAAAKADSVTLRIVSGTRNFNSQKSIWEAKWTGARKVQGGEDLSKTTPDPVERALKILRFSSMPSTSRHHWGTDIDLNALNNAFFDEGNGKKIYDWLSANAAEYGFCQPYSPKGAERPDGYNEERWHWSYLPVAQPLTVKAQKMLKNEMIEGFLGSEVATEIDVVRKYVLGINKECMN